MESLIEKTVTDYEQGRASRREFLAGLTAIMAFASSASSQKMSANTRSQSTFHAIELNHLALNVRDLDESQKFYEKYLGLKLIRKIPKLRFMGFGTHFIALIKSNEKRPVGVDHFCFTLEDYDQNDVIKKLKLEGLKPETEFERTYFYDPNGIRLQVAHDDYPLKGGRPKLTEELHKKIYKK